MVCLCRFVLVNLQCIAIASGCEMILYIATLADRALPFASRLPSYPTFANTTLTMYYTFCALLKDVMIP